MNSRMQWNWFIWGKHPGVSDFIFAGSQTPLFQRFTKWVDTGFSKVDPALKKKSRHCSWRFWTRGTADAVVCGLVRNSCDSYGRSFPLLIMGTGLLKDWSRNRSLLPFAFESIWKGLEYAAAARYDTVKSLDGAMQLIEPPEPSWRRYQARIHSAANLYTQEQFDTQKTGNNRLYKIDCRLPENLPRDLCFCSNMVATNDNGAPTAVFIGETGNRIAVAMIEDILKPADFTWLWSLQTE
ncbi:MAG: type VI secretion system-associated protein TagF [Desulfatitalea sp.]|nr:type VI secretion system-associated protein TagF [Desulfatitalea sp.]